MSRKIVNGDVRVGQNSLKLSGVDVGGARRKTSSMEAKDPFSTPARRRRIIADVAKFLLKQYCVKACENVMRFRKWTAASLIIQRSWRCYAARKLRNSLVLAKRNRASIVLQSMVRQSFARHKLKELRLAEWTKRALKLAKVLKRFWQGRLVSRRKRRERALHRIRMLKKKAAAAVHIQRCFRGMMGRKLSKHLASLRSQEYRRRHFAAIKIQACARRRRGRRLTQQLRKRRISLWKVGYRCVYWYKRWLFRRTKASIVAQRVARGFLGRCRARRTLADKLRREREEAERRRLELLRLAALAAAEEAATRRIEVRISVKLAILRRMSVLGPAEAILWCIKHSILQFFENDAGYSLGPVLLQVVDTVESVFPSLVKRPAPTSGKAKDNSIPTSNEQASHTASNIVDVDADSKCIKLRKWDDDAKGGGRGRSSELPSLPFGPAQLPFEWGREFKCGVGAQITINLESWSIDIKVKLSSDAFSHEGGERGNPICWTLVTIVLEAEKDKDHISKETLLESSFAKSMGDYQLDEQDAADFKFKFKDTVVLLQPPPKYVPPPELLPIEVLPDEAKEVETNPQESPLCDDSFTDSLPSSPGSPQVPQRITIMVEPNWDAFARTIQKRAKLWVQGRIQACRLIQRVYHRYSRLRIWRRLVCRVLERAHRACCRIQTAARKRLGSTKAQRIRLQLCARLKASSLRIAKRVVDDLSDYKFASEEELVCWGAFGVEPADALRFVASDPERQQDSLPGEVENALSSSDKSVVHKRSKLLRDLMAFAKLPPAVPGSALPGVHLVTCVSEQQLMNDTGLPFGTVASLRLKSDKTALRKDESIVSPVHYGFPNVFIKAAERLAVQSQV